VTPPFTGLTSIQEQNTQIIENDWISLVLNQKSAMPLDRLPQELAMLDLPIRELGCILVSEVVHDEAKLEDRFAGTLAVQ
jgi:hypothetical protein